MADALPGKPEGATWTEQDEREARTHDAFLNLADSKPRKRADKRFHAMALQILCRAFKDGADVVYYEWLAWYKPEGWFTAERAFGAFLYTKLEPERAEILRLRGELAISREYATSWRALAEVCERTIERRESLESVRSLLSSPSGTGSTTGWWCVVQHSHGICNTLNDAEDESCDACGNDRARSPEVEEAGEAETL